MTLGAIPEARAPREDELERDEKFPQGRVVLVAVDHGPNSQTAFSWVLDQFVIPADTVHLIHVLARASSSCLSPKVAGDHAFTPVVEATKLLFDRLAKEATKKGHHNIISKLREGDAGKELCAEAERISPVAVVMGSRGLGAIKSWMVGSATEYCVRHSPVPLIIVPHNYHLPAPSTAAEEKVRAEADLTYYE